MTLHHFTDTKGYGRYLILGKDLMLRSLLLSSSTLFFTYAGVREGAIAVGANALLMQFFSIFSYFMDGFAYAGESLSGRFYGAGRIDLLNAVIGRLFGIGIVLSPVSYTHLESWSCVHCVKAKRVTMRRVTLCRDARSERPSCQSGRVSIVSKVTASWF